jgi:hypothetical protein
MDGALLLAEDIAEFTITNGIITYAREWNRGCLK